MTSSISKAAYTDCYTILDQAIDAEHGIRKKVPDHGAAHHLRQRLHYARTLKRRQSMEIYPEDHPSHGLSAYDDLIVQIKEIDNQWYVYIKPRIVDGDIEILKAAE